MDSYNLKLKLPIKTMKIKQVIPAVKKYNKGIEVWFINTSVSKLQPRKVGPFVVVQANYNTNTYAVQDYCGKQQELNYY